MASSLGLRRRAVEAFEQGDGSLDAVATRFTVGRASLVLWLALRRRTDAVAPPTPAAPRPR
jgi:transposase